MIGWPDGPRKTCRMRRSIRRSFVGAPERDIAKLPELLRK